MNNLEKDNQRFIRLGRVAFMSPLLGIILFFIVITSYQPSSDYIGLKRLICAGLPYMALSLVGGGLGIFVCFKKLTVCSIMSIILSLIPFLILGFYFFFFFFR